MANSKSKDFHGQNFGPILNKTFYSVIYGVFFKHFKHCVEALDLIIITFVFNSMFFSV